MPWTKVGRSARMKLPPQVAAPSARVQVARANARVADARLDSARRRLERARSHELSSRRDVLGLVAPGDVIGLRRVDTSVNAYGVRSRLQSRLAPWVAGLLARVAARTPLAAATPSTSERSVEEIRLELLQALYAQGTLRPVDDSQRP